MCPPPLPDDAATTRERLSPGLGPAKMSGARIEHAPWGRERR
ncbi:hypothetical protein NSU_2585 [Novosphingobium pentaromativorans US6-1]|uniref:Uncharacterized protein n=1 Tax=Novosphingobium pentaromativorans US6-1 TaxID=1088721 RepID=G6EE14_9SPHN|nr:hypothetical protein NSU_2585 [Novosphingobium pentaromativorans US6-1]